jgi:lipopolysaccharide/colanic/teichoic acid biosynthesis glycosyltransferase
MTTRRPRWTGTLSRIAASTFVKLSSRVRSRMPSVLKRSIDVVLAALALLTCMPLFGVVALLIKVEDGGPVLFWQTRVGRHGRLFRFPKFRSMAVNAEARLAELRGSNQHGAGITFKMQHDPRITRTGRVLRRFSLDELPQLWCVFRGDMSLVGPRPALPKEVARYRLSDRRRLDAIPGLTCTWQVSGRANLPFPIQCQMDVDYIRRQSLKLDIEILAKTLPAVVSGKGAY